MEEGNIFQYKMASVMFFPLYNSVSKCGFGIPLEILREKFGMKGSNGRRIYFRDLNVCVNLKIPGEIISLYSQYQKSKVFDEREKYGEFLEKFGKKISLKGRVEVSGLLIGEKVYNLLIRIKEIKN